VHGQVLVLAGDHTSAADVGRAFARADAWESYDPGDPAGSVFVRRQVQATTADGERVEAHVYVSSPGRLRRRHPGLHLARIEDGVWVRG
jgi:hypothetical protein